METFVVRFENGAEQTFEAERMMNAGEGDTRTVHLVPKWADRVGEQRQADLSRRPRPHRQGEAPALVAAEGGVR
jgi:hypothetical protein